MKKIIFLAIIFMLSLNLISFAENSKSDDDLLITGIEQLDNINQESKYSIKDPADKEALDKATSYLVRKQNEAIWFLQILAQPISILVFIICSYKTLIGAIGSSKVFNSGIIGMILSTVLYAVIIYAQVIFQVSINLIST